MGKTPTPSQKVFFTHHFPSQQWVSWFLKKLAVRTEAGDTPNRVNCSGLAKYRAGAERELGGASGEKQGWLVQGSEGFRQGKEGECPDRRPLQCTVQAGGEDPPQHLPQPSSNK